MGAGNETFAAREPAANEPGGSLRVRPTAAKVCGRSGLHRPVKRSELLSGGSAAAVDPSATRPAILLSFTVGATIVFDVERDEDDGSGGNEMVSDGAVESKFSNRRN